MTDQANVLNGYWKSNGPNAGADNNSQVDPYKVTLNGGQNNATADFGYYNKPAKLGDYVWEDTNGNGIQDSGEPAIQNAVVTLTITWPSSGTGTTIVKTTTGMDGKYLFDNLLLDENMTSGTGAGNPTFSISIATPSGYLPTLTTQGGNTALDSNPNPTAATVTKGGSDLTYDFGFVRPNSVGDFVWLDMNGNGVQDAGETRPGECHRDPVHRPRVRRLARPRPRARAAPISFTNLGPGQYKVCFTTPSGYSFSPTCGRQRRDGL